MKKILSLFLTIILFMGMGSNVQATTIEVSEYEKILNSINQEFNTELGYIGVDENEITIEEYEIFTRELASKQRELLDYIAIKEMENKIGRYNMNSLNDYNVTPRITSSRAVVGYESYFYITATYDVISGIKVTNIRNASFGLTKNAQLNNYYVIFSSGPKYGYINGGRDGSVTYVGDIYLGTSWPSYKNVTLYAEFRA